MSVGPHGGWNTKEGAKRRIYTGVTELVDLPNRACVSDELFRIERQSPGCPSLAVRRLFSLCDLPIPCFARTRR